MKKFFTLLSLQGIISMKFLSNLTLIIGLFLVYSPSQAMIVRSSCLLRNTGRLQNRLVILHDKHAFDPNELIKRGHISDMRTLISTVAENPKTTPFFVEISEEHKRPERLANFVESPSNIAIKLALENNMKYGNIKFVPFDNRNHYDFWMRDMLWQTDQFIQAIQHNYQFPSDFHHVTAENFLEHLNSRYAATAESIEASSLPLSIKQQNHAANKQKHEDCHAALNHLLKSYNVSQKQHLFRLISQLSNSEKTQLFVTLTDENNFAVDTSLLNTVLEQSENKPLSVVLAGTCHSTAIEKCLLSQFPEFERDVSSSMLLPDLKADSLWNIQWPKDIPDHFMNKNTEQFITMNHANE